jgi:hypothetical protein
MKKQIIINYEWWADNHQEIKESHKQALEEAAIDRIVKMMNDGYTSGELYDEDGDGISYSGWWSLSMATL